MSDLPTAPAVARNRDAILEVLLDEFVDQRHVLEIGSGTGEHAVFFAPRLPWLIWQTSDRKTNHAGIRAWLEHVGDVVNVRLPIELDVSSPPSINQATDGVFSANTAHIMGEPEVSGMFSLVGGLLPRTGKFCLYGPFNQQGQFTSESNERFDASLRAQDAKMGIRELETLDEFAKEAGMIRTALYGMPANNHLAVWSATGSG